MALFDDTVKLRVCFDNSCIVEGYAKSFPNFDRITSYEVIDEFKTKECNYSGTWDDKYISWIVKLNNDTKT